MWDQAGIVRDAASLRSALAAIDRIEAAVAPGFSPARQELRNLLLVGRLVVQSALARPESIGAHFRADAVAGSPAGSNRHIAIHPETGLGYFTYATT
jgi:L-aspartate oxidase